MLVTVHVALLVSMVLISVSCLVASVVAEERRVAGLAASAFLYIVLFVLTARHLAFPVCIQVVLLMLMRPPTHGLR